MKKLTFTLCLHFIALGVSLAQVHTGDLNLFNQSQVDAFNYSEVNGQLVIAGTNVTNLKKLSTLTKAKSVDITNTNIINCEGLQNLKVVDDYITIHDNNNITNLTGLSGLNTCGALHILKNPSLTDASGLSGLTTIKGILHITMNKNLVTIGMSALTSIEGSEITNNDNLKSLGGLSSLRNVTGKLYISLSSSLTDICAIRPLVATGSVGTIQILASNGNYLGNDEVLKACSVANNALTFDGVDDLVETGIQSFYKNSFTIEGWIKPRPGAILSTYQDTKSAVYVEVTNTGTVRFVVRNPPANSGGADLFGKTNVITDGKWHHFAAVKGDDDYLYLYIDGVPDGKSPGKIADFSATPFNVRLGMNAVGATRYYKGSMDEIRCWNIARSQQDILANKDKTLTGNEQGLAVYYKFNQGTANGDNKTVTTLTDAKSALNGALQKFLLTGTTSNFTTGAPVQ
jgi:Concanavalin A-like lectin/glucanases superfamily